MRVRSHWEGVALIGHSWLPYNQEQRSAHRENTTGRESFAVIATLGGQQLPEASREA